MHCGKCNELGNSIRKLESVRISDQNLVNPSAFPVAVRINKEIFEKSVNKPSITSWLGLVMDILDQFSGAIKALLLLCL